MKRLFVLLLSLCLVLCACGNASPDEGTSAAENTQEESTHTEIAVDNTIRGVWLTSYELAPDSYDFTAEQYRAQLQVIFDKLVANSINHAFVQVRANNDAFYYSDIFPSSERLTGVQGKRPPYDALKIMVEEAHLRSVNIHAWINPYRVSADTQDITTLSEDNPARIWYEAGNNTNVVLTAGGIYLNQASADVQKLILDGVREILENYAVDGIHIDDYFYPSVDEEIDSTEYAAYVSGGGTLSLGNFRRQNVNALVSAMYRATKTKSPRLLFTISPCGDIEKNISQLYADVALWCSREGYADYIMPQIYYGFNNEVRPFEQNLRDWLELCDSSKLVVGLAIYKQGQEDIYAGSGKSEWLENNDIIARQIAMTAAYECSGYCLFSYSYM